MMQKLLDSHITIVAELAQSDENVTFRWAKAIPKRDLDVFGDEIQTETIGRFSALGGVSTRPVYAVWKDRLTVRRLPADEAIAELLTSPPTFSDVAFATLADRQYLQTENFFCKLVRLPPGKSVDNLIRFSNEAHALQELSAAGITPYLRGFVRAPGVFGIVMDRVKGAVKLSEYIKKLDDAQRSALAIEFALRLRIISDRGLFWNDCRLHNAVVDANGNIKLIDFEICAYAELEDNHKRALWNLWVICHGKSPISLGLVTKDLPELPPPSPEQAETWQRIVAIMKPADQGLKRAS